MTGRGPGRVAVIGGGIIGCTATALLAEAGSDVTLLEATGIGAGASGRNSGVIQHPFDAELLPLHMRTLELYRALARSESGLKFPDDPVGILLLTDEPAAAAERAEALSLAYPELEPMVLGTSEVIAHEPSLAPDWEAVRLATGYPVVPDAATRAMAGRALRAGATIRTGLTARPWIDDGRVRGVLVDDAERLAAELVLVAAGPWTPEVIDDTPAWPAIVRTWGVTVQVELAAPPRHVLEEGVVHTINVPGGQDGSLFSLVAAEGVATVGSTFLATEPDPSIVASRLLERGARFVPGLATAAVREVRLCARPQSVDGRPFIGPVPGVEGLFVCAGHGPWGMSIGPASTELVVNLILDRGDEIPEALRSERAV